LEKKVNFSSRVFLYIQKLRAEEKTSNMPKVSFCREKFSETGEQKDGSLKKVINKV